MGQRTCADCGEELEDLEVPCPMCGSSRQSATVQAQAALAVASTLNVGLSITYNPMRPWYSQWQTVRQQLASVERTLEQGNYRGNDIVKREFENFFTHCFHMHDWLVGDQSTGLTATVVRDFIANDPALRLCAGIANTSKHHTRSQANAMTARITTISADANGVRATISWTEGTDSGTEDALTLGRQCVTAWETFLRTHGLRSPV